MCIFAPTVLGSLPLEQLAGQIFYLSRLGLTQLVLSSRKKSSVFKQGLFYVNHSAHFT
jgi:hypothetical protein